MILLTGASGFIGKHLLAKLIQVYGKDHILALTSAPVTEAHYLLHNGYNFEADYFIQSGYGTQIHTIIHAGAFIPKSGKHANDWEPCNSSIYSTGKLLSADLPNLQKIVYISTVDVYGASELIDEKTPEHPMSLYGASKLYVEKMLTNWAYAETKTLQILRVGHVYGPGEEEYQKIIPITIKKLLQNKPLQIWGKGNELRSFIYIDDLISAILKATSAERELGIVNLAGSQKITIADLVKKLIAISGKETKVEMVPIDVPGRNLVFNNSKMRAVLLTQEISLEVGLMQEWAYMKKLLE